MTSEKGTGWLGPGSAQPPGRISERGIERAQPTLRPWRTKEGWLKLREEALWAVSRNVVLRSLLAPRGPQACGSHTPIPTPVPRPPAEHILSYLMVHGSSFLFQLTFTLLLGPLGKTHPHRLVRWPNRERCLAPSLMPQSF